MSYPDTLSRLEGQVRQLEEARMHEARERDQLRSENAALRREISRLEEAIAMWRQHSYRVGVNQQTGEPK